MFGRKLDRPRLSPSGTADGHLKGSLEQNYIFVRDSCIRWFMGVNNNNIVHSKSRLPYDFRS